MRKSDPIEIPISQGFYTSDSLPISHQECVNLVPVQQQVATLSQRQLIGSDGIEQIASSGDTADEINRGAHVMDGVPYFVQGSRLYRLDRGYIEGVETFSVSEVGLDPVVITGSGRVSMADNGYQLMIVVPGGHGFIYNKDTDVIEQVVTGIFAPDSTIKPNYVVFIDGYFACSTTDKTWYVSNLGDGTQWDILDFGTAEADPDPIVTPVVYNNQIFMIGSETMEGFQNIGGSGFPFQRSNIFLDKGCFAPFSLVATNQRFFMIGGGTNEKAAVWQYSGGEFSKVSTNAIDNVMDNYTDSQLEAVFALTWAVDGQYYISFTFTDRTFVFNMSTSLWHELKSGIANEYDDLEQTRWRVNSLVRAYGYTLVGDSQDGRIGKTDRNILSEYGNDIIRVFSPQPVANNGRSFRLPAVELTMEAGIGNGVVEPMVSMAISEDLKTYQYERNRRIGKIGEYKRRTIWRKLGRIPRFCSFRFRISDQIKVSIIKLEAYFA